MPVCLLYLLKVSACTAVFYAAYWALFRRLTFFSWVRYFLLSAALASLLIPLLTISVTWPSPTPPNASNGFDQHIGLVADKAFTPAVNTPVEAGTLPFVCWIIYACGAALFLFRWLRSLWAVRQLLKDAQMTRRGNIHVWQGPAIQTHASFFHNVFLAPMPDKEMLAQVLAHETLHSRYLHTIDLLFMDLLQIMCWFNPVIYWYRRSLVQIHEYEVDAAMVVRSDRKAYALLLLATATRTTHTVANTFSRQPLKTRIMMLFSTPSRPSHKWLFLAVLPLMAGLLYSFADIRHVAAPTEVPPALPGQFTVMIDAGHGGTDAGSRANTSIPEKDLTLQLALALQQACAKENIRVLMTRADDRGLTPQQRVAQANQHRPDLFLSLHINAGEKQRSLSGTAGIINQQDVYMQPSAIAYASIARQLAGVRGLPEVKELTKPAYNVYILRHTACPAVLLQLGYITNNTDYEFIRDAGHQQQIAAAIAKGIVAYQQRR